MDRALVKNAGSETQRKRARRLEQLAIEQARADLQWVLSEPSGRRFLWRLLVQGGHRDTTFAVDAIQMAALTGQRDLMLWLEAQIYDADYAAMGRIRAEADEATYRREQETAALYARGDESPDGQEAGAGQ